MVISRKDRLVSDADAEVRARFTGIDRVLI